LRPVSEEADVKSTLGKVTSGDADAGLVYLTDVDAAGGAVEGVNFTEAGQATTDYPIAVLKDAPQPQLAQQFVDLVTGEVGRRALQDAGFGPAK
jgi:molybdate transport system substrate-binding protein